MGHSDNEMEVKLGAVAASLVTTNNATFKLCGKKTV